MRAIKSPPLPDRIPQDRLVINDFGNKLLRLVNLKEGNVSSLAGSEPSTLVEGPASKVSMAGIRDMVYLSAADSLFFSQPDQMTLKRLDMKTGEVTLVLNKKEGLFRPTALCGAGNKLYVADRDQFQVYQIEWKDGVASAPVSVATSAAKVLALAESNGTLYALQSHRDAPLERLFPNTQPVSFMSVWGDEIQQPGFYHPSFFGQCQFDDPLGFISDPFEKRKLYIANPRLNIITSCRDLFGNHDVDGNPSSYEPPVEKPLRTFRVLLVGDSRSVMVLGDNPKRTYYSPISKQMALELNTLAALEDAPMNFEVLDMSRGGDQCLFLWPTYQVPDVVRDHDIDLVLIMQPPDQHRERVFLTYLTRPLTKDGIPAKSIDPEYLLKPPLQRIPEGEIRQFYDMCKDRHFVKIKDNNFIFDDALHFDPEIHNSLVQLYGKPLGILCKELSGMKTSSGKPVSMLLCFTPMGTSRPCLEDGKIWEDATQTFHIPFLNLHDEMTALRIPYYPLSEVAGAWHFYPDGHIFFGRLLAYELIRKGLVPWKPAYQEPKTQASQSPPSQP